MTSASLDAAIASVQALRAQFHKERTRQVKKQPEKALAKATVLAWFNEHRPNCGIDDTALATANGIFSRVLVMSERDSLRSRYDSELKALWKNLIAVRDVALRAPPRLAAFSAAPPEFARIVQDARLLAILERRWRETAACLAGKASLAASIMLGGLLEALLLAKAKALANQGPIFTAKNAPKDRKSGRTKSNLREWSLYDFIQVGHELGWIGSVAKAVGHTIRDFRNLVHPNEELERGVVLDEREALALVRAFQTIVDELLR